MLALVFGITGQDGYYLKRLLETLSIRVVGVSRSSPRHINGDVGDYHFVETIIKQHAPNFIYHFSADSTTNHHALFNNHNAITTGTLNILEAARIHSPNARIFLSGSAVQFCNDGTPINENTPFAATSAYAASRISAVQMARYYRHAFGSKVYVGYFFNHDSPLRTDKHINQAIVHYLKVFDKNVPQKLSIGSITVRKEFNFAGDLVEAAWVLLQQDKVFEVVLGCGHAYSIKDWLEYCFNSYGLEYEDHITFIEGFSAEYDVLVSNPQLITNMGWRPRVSFSQLADLMLEQ